MNQPCIISLALDDMYLIFLSSLLFFLFFSCLFFLWFSYLAYIDIGDFCF